MTAARRIVAFGVALFGTTLLFISANSTTQGQDKDKKPDDVPKVEPKPRGQLYPGWRDLGLSKEQINDIYKIQTEHRTKIDALEEQIAKLKKEEKAKAEQILTPAQKARLKEIGDKDKIDPPPKDAPPPPKDKVVPPKDAPPPPAKDKQ